MVFCRACNKKVEDCEHCVFPVEAPRINVVDSKVATLAYERDERILEIGFHSGQVWQLSQVPPVMQCSACRPMFIKSCWDKPFHRF